MPPEANTPDPLSSTLPSQGGADGKREPSSGSSGRGHTGMMPQYLQPTSSPVPLPGKGWHLRAQLSWAITESGSEAGQSKFTDARGAPVTAAVSSFPRPARPHGSPEGSVKATHGPQDSGEAIGLRSADRTAFAGWLAVHRGLLRGREDVGREAASGIPGVLAAEGQTLT